MGKHETKNRLQFADTRNGRIRRNERRAAIAAKRAWLEL